MAAIKRFFEKKKLDVKFKKAGSGHKLTEDTRSLSPQPSQRPGTSQGRPQAESEAARAAREAALARMSQPRPGTANNQLKALKLQARAELEAERALQQGAAAAGPTEVYRDGAPLLEQIGVYYNCPMVTPEVLPKQDMEKKIEEFLLAQLAEEPQMTSALMIHTLNKNAEKVKLCIETLCKYLDNIIANPDEEKFRKIRISNKAFQERVCSCDGTEEFIQSVGFKQRKLPFQDGEDDFYVLDEDQAKDTERLNTLKEILLAAEPIKAELDRGLRLFHPSPKATKFELHNDFYNITPEEMRKEQQLKQEAVEKLGMLRTKAMRERDEQRELRRYRFALVRVRMPNGVLLQGTFRATEKVSVLAEFVRDYLVNDWLPFTLSTATGQKLTEMDSTLAEVGIAPATVLNFALDPSVVAEIKSQQGTFDDKNLIKPEIMVLIQDL
ncbi:UBX domain-containing protein 6-like [Lingula anatina]|uniref:UBX domain-containing protein 6-like n=1 Tax=Lingula anatina TaxID=7574 RepID=A0A1S3ISZ6_LINAN|nr:UBX domain-containing protein 6-like [Lingula anatina]|eukprot:XP_013400654.1 UBX domain-containing protein 6-like [Lingula anatina]